jgi:hypothetical protein
MEATFRNYKVEDLPNLDPKRGDFRLLFDSVLGEESNGAGLETGQRLLLISANNIRKVLAKINARLISLQNGIIEIEYDNRRMLISCGLRSREVVIQHPEGKTIHLRQLPDKRNSFERVVQENDKSKNKNQRFANKVSITLHELFLDFFKDFPLVVPDISKFNS